MTRKIYGKYFSPSCFTSKLSENYFSASFFNSKLYEIISPQVVVYLQQTIDPSNEAVAECICNHLLSTASSKLVITNRYVEVSVPTYTLETRSILVYKFGPIKVLISKKCCSYLIFQIIFHTNCIFLSYLYVENFPTSAVKLTFSNICHFFQFFMLSY